MVSDLDITVLLAQQANNHDYDTLKRTYYIRIDHPQTAAGRKVEERWIDGTEGLLLKTTLNGNPRFLRKRPAHLAGKEQHTDERGHKTVWTYDEHGNPRARMFHQVAPVYEPFCS